MSDPSGSAGLPAVLERHRAELHAILGVVGVAHGLDDSGSAAVVVYVLDRDAARRLPSGLEGYRVRAIVSGPVDASGPGTA